MAPYVVVMLLALSIARTIQAGSYMVYPRDRSNVMHCKWIGNKLLGLLGSDFIQTFGDEKGEVVDFWVVAATKEQIWEIQGWKLERDKPTLVSSFERFLIED